jgi:homoserine O-succinyltransferase
VTVRLIGAAQADQGPSGHVGAAAGRWTCALVNNMPDSAFVATEEQFLGLLDAASGKQSVEVRRATMDGVPRGEQAAARIAAEYLPLTCIRQDPPDVLIVTGANPLALHIEDEPYWSELEDLLTWGRTEVPTMLLSCLSAHAALVVYDGLERRLLEAKCTGVFPQTAEPTHPLAAGLVPPIVLPHSRLNTVEVGDLVAAGYRLALHSDAVGWSVATKMVDHSQVVLVQGHPEYGPTSLLREYLRDVRRYVHHERDEVPRLPGDCVAPDDWAALEELHRRVIGGERDPALLETFDFDQAGARAPWSWRTTAIRLYENWLARVPQRSD